MAEWVKVAHIGDVPENAIKVVKAKAQRLALSNIKGSYFAIEDLCTHDGGPLGEGELIDDLVECPRHGARFNVTTGQAVTLPAVIPVATFPVKVEGNDVFVQVS